jgi:hypothetical protein
MHLSSDCWGFPWVLHRWGVEAVLSTVWDIFDTTVLLLFSEFYRDSKWHDQPLLALQRARRFVRNIGIAEAHHRLREIDPDAPLALHEELDVIEELFGSEHPFAETLFWGPICFSGLHRAPHDTASVQ